jgi:cell division protein FtsL
MYTFGRERRNINYGELLIYSICIFFFITGVLFYIWPYNNILNINYEFEKLLKERAKLIQSNKLLKIEMASLKSLDRVEDIATAQLGLSFPHEGQVVIIVGSKE